MEALHHATTVYLFPVPVSFLHWQRLILGIQAYVVVATTLHQFVWGAQVNGIVEQIVKFGKVTRPVLGISFAPEQSVEQLGVSGVLVLDAPAGGPAGKAVSIYTSL